MAGGRNPRKTLYFIGLTFLLSWALVIAYRALGGKWALPYSLVIAVVYMFGPMTAAIIVQRFIYEEPLAGPLGISFRLNRWFLVAWLLPPVIAFAALGIGLLFPGIEYSPDMTGFFERLKSTLTPQQLEQAKRQAAAFPIHPIWIGLLQGLIAGVTINALAAFGEELGWRGFLQREFSHLGFWKSSTLVGAIWGVWHAPLVLHGHNYPQHPVAGVFMMTAFCVLLGPLLSYVRLRAQSVIAAAVMHGTVNGTYGLALVLTKGGSDLTVGGNGLAGFVALAIANLALLAYDRLGGKDSIKRT